MNIDRGQVSQIIKNNMKEFCLIIWMLISLIFVFSIVGLIMFIPKDQWENKDNTPSTWYSIGIKLLNSIIEK